MSGLNLRLVLAKLAHEPEAFDDPYIYVVELRRLEALGYVARPKGMKSHVRPYVTPAGAAFLRSLKGASRPPRIESRQQEVEPILVAEDRKGHWDGVRREQMQQDATRANGEQQ